MSLVKRLRYAVDGRSFETREDAIMHVRKQRLIEVLGKGEFDAELVESFAEFLLGRDIRAGVISALHYDGRRARSRRSVEAEKKAA